MRFGIHLPRVLFEGEGGGGAGGGGAGGGTGGGNTGGSGGGGRPNPADLLPQYGGDAVRMASKISELEGDNYKLRRRRDELQGEVDLLKGKVPGEGTILISKDEKALLDAIKAANLGKPEDIQNALKERDDFKVKLEAEQTEHGKTKRGITLRDVAQDMGYKLPVLERLDALTSGTLPGLDYEKKTEKQDGKDVEVWYVKFKDGEGENAPLKEQALSEFATTRSEWKDFLPALTAEAAGGQNNGARHVAQGSGGSSATGSRFDQIRQRNQKAAEAAAKQQGQSIEEIMHIGSNA